MKKKLIINPRKEDMATDMVFLKFADVFAELFAKVYQQEPNKNFKPLVTQDGHIRRFISNVEPMRTSIQNYSGKEIKTASEGEAYLMKIGTEIYGDSSWAYRLVINEVKYGRATLYSIEADSADLAKKIADGLEDVADVEFKKPYRKNNRTPETIKETETASPTAQNNEQEQQ